MTLRSRFTVPFAVLVALMLLLAACGGGTTESTAPSDEPAESVAAPASDEPAASEAAEETPAPADLSRATLRLDFLAAPSHIPFVYGVAEGIYAAHGIDLTVLEGSGSPVTLQIVASRADKFGFVDGGVYALGKAQEQPVQMVGTIIQRNPADLLFFCDQDIETPEDLAGKTFAAPAGDGVMTLLPSLLQAHGLSEDDINVVNVAPAARIQTLIERQADVGVGYGYASALRYYQAAEQADAGEMCHMRLADYGINTLGHGIVVNQQTLDTEADLVQSFMDATIEAIEATADNQEAAIDSIMEYFDLADSEREIMEQGLAVLRESLHTEASDGCSVGYVVEEDAEQTIDLLTQYSGLETSLPPADFYDNQFLPTC